MLRQPPSLLCVAMIGLAGSGCVWRDGFAPHQNTGVVLGGGDSGAGGGGDGVGGDGDPGTPPVSTASVTSVVFASPPGDYVTDETLEVTVTFSEPVTVSGVVTLTLHLGFDTVDLVCALGGPTTTVSCTYTVTATDLDINGLGVDSPVLAAAGALLDDLGLPVTDLDFVPPDGSGHTVNLATYVPSPSTYSTDASLCIQGNFRGSAIYRPSLYFDTPDPVAVLFFFHGAGEESPGAFDPNIIDNQGLPLYLSTGNDIDFLTFMPQMYGGWAGDSTSIREYVECMLDNEPRVDRDSVHITGLSSGGLAVFTQVSEHYDLYASASPIAGFHETGIVTDYDAMRAIPMWAFHGDADGTVDIDSGIFNSGGTRTIIDTWNANDPAPRVAPKFTIFVGAGHSIWNQVYDGSWLTTETPPNLFTWIAAQRRDRAVFADVALDLVQRGLDFGALRLSTQQEMWELGRDLSRARTLIDGMPNGGVGTASDAYYQSQRDAIVALLDAAVSTAEASQTYLDWTIADRVLSGLSDPSFEPLAARLAAVTPGPAPLLAIFRRYGIIPVPAPWNDVSEDPLTPWGPISLTWADGTPSGISISLLQVFTNWEAADIGDNSGIWPDAAFQRAYSLAGAGTAILRLTGLTPSGSYRLTLTGRSEISNSTVRYRINAVAQTLFATNNVNTVVTFDSVADGTGQLDIEVEAVSGRGVIAGFILEAL